MKTPSAKTKGKKNKSVANKEMAERLINLLQNKNIGFDSVENRPVSIPVPTIRKIAQWKRTKNPATALGIYIFMYARGREERTNKPWVNNKYIAKGLRLNPQTVAKYRKQLTELGLIQDIPLRKDGRIYKHVTHIRYYDGITIRDPQLIEFITTLCKSYTIENLQGSSTVVSACNLPSEEENAYNTAARTKRPGQRSVKPLVLHPDKTKDTPEHRLSLQLFKILRPIVEPNADGMPKRGWEVDEKTGKNKRTGPRDWRDWHKAFRSKLSEGRHDEQEISRILKWYGDNIRERYTPQLYSANTFCKELHRLVKQMKTGNEDTMQSRRKRAQQNGSCEWTENGIRYRMYADGSYTGWKGLSIVDTGFIGSKGDKPDNFESEVS